MKKPEINVGSFVEIDTEQSGADKHTKEHLVGWATSYRWPMEVVCRGVEHVVLKDNTGRIVHFGSTGDPSFHVGHVKLAEVSVGGSQ